MAYHVYSIVSAFMLLSHCTTAEAKVNLLPNRLYNGTMTAETVSGTGSLDGLKLASTANATSYEWSVGALLKTNLLNANCCVEGGILTPCLLLLETSP